MTSKAIARLALLFGVVAACAPLPTPDDPFPGSGGKPFAEPSRDEFCNGTREFDPARFSSFRLGITTKLDVVKALGKPTWWGSSDTGASLLAYDFYRKTATCQFPFVTPTAFEFDAGKKLVDVDYVGSSKEFPETSGPESNILVWAHFGSPPEELFLDGITPGTKPDEIYLGGFIRTRLHVRETVYGEPRDRTFVVTLLVGDGQPIKGYDDLVLLKRDRFGIVRAAAWGFCIDAQVAKELAIDNSALTRIDRKYFCKADR